MQGIAMPTGEGGTGERRPSRLDKKLTIGTNRLKGVVFHDNRLARKHAHEKRRESGTSDMDDIGAPNEPPKRGKGRLAHHGERKRRVVITSCWSLRDEPNFELCRPIRITAFGKPAGERKHNGLNAADARHEKVGIDKQFHSRNFFAIGATLDPAESCGAGTDLPDRQTAARTASTMPAVDSSGDQVFIRSRA